MIELPKLPSHPDPYAFTWSEAEQIAIRDYATAAVTAAVTADRKAMAAEVAQFRDGVLNQRGPLAENGMTSDQINDVLGLFDDCFSTHVPRNKVSEGRQ